MVDEKDQHRRSEDRTAQDIQDMLKVADDREQREMLLLLQRLADGVQTAITTGQINNQMTLNGNAALQAHIEEFKAFKEVAITKWSGDKGAWGVVNRIAPWIASGLCTLVLALGTWAGTKLLETNAIITTHLAVSANQDNHRDIEIDKLSGQLDKLTELSRIQHNMKEVP